MVGRALNAADIQQFSSEIGGVEERKRWCLYDHLTAGAAGTDVLGDYNFFQVPVGQGGKTLSDTNMRLAGTLPARYGMEVWDIRVQIGVKPSAQATVAALKALVDLYYELTTQGSLVFRQGQKTELEIAPVGILAAGWGVFPGALAIQSAAAADAGGFFVGDNGHPSKAALWDMDPLPIIILPQRAFQVVINYPANIATAAADVVHWWVHLDGILHRAA